MNKLQSKIRRKQADLLESKQVFKNEDGAIDLSSIMVGIIVIGLIGGVIAATVFSVIPWTQDNAAKQQLESVVSAENAYMGLTSDAANPLPTGGARNTYGNSSLLETAGLLKTGTTYCVVSSTDGKRYTAFSQSDSGKLFSVTSESSKPVVHTGAVPTDCQFIQPPDAPYVDPTPLRTSFTYRCDTTVTAGALPLFQIVGSGTETWSDGLTRTVSGTTAPARTLDAGVTYTVHFDGKYNTLARNATVDSMAIAPCLRSVEHIGSETGVTSFNQAFAYSTNLTSVPARIPSTVDNLMYSFRGAEKFNDPNISKWDTSKVWRADYMFNGATAFNQPLNDWNVSKLAYAGAMFNQASSFNQPLDKWDTSSLQSASSMFAGAIAFNQDLSGWNTAKVTSGTGFAPNTFPDAYLPANTTKLP